MLRQHVIGNWTQFVSSMILNGLNFTFTNMRYWNHTKSPIFATTDGRQILAPKEGESPLSQERCLITRAVPQCFDCSFPNSITSLMTHDIGWSGRTKRTSFIMTWSIVKYKLINTLNSVTSRIKIRSPSYF